MKEKNKKSKKPIKIITIIAICGVALFILICIMPFLIFSVAMIWQMFFDIPKKPAQTYGEFPFKLVYEYKGEVKTIEDVIICDYAGYSYAIETGNTRDWDYKYKNNDEYGSYNIDDENEPTLSIDVPSACEYYMGENNYSYEDTEPYIYFSDDETGTQYNEKEEIDVLEIKIVEWNPSKPIKNKFK